MKIKEIVSVLTGDASRSKLALRISRCQPVIRKAFRKWREEEVLPLVQLAFETPDGKGYLELSSRELVEVYDMKEFQALLFLDELLKADQEKDVPRFKALLDMLQAGAHRPASVVSEETKAYIQKNNPEAWAYYQQLCARQAEQDQEEEQAGRMALEEEL